MINWPLIKSPINWLTVLIMVMIGAFALQEILRFAGVGTANGCNCSSLSSVPSNSSVNS